MKKFLIKALHVTTIISLGLMAYVYNEFYQIQESNICLTIAVLSSALALLIEETNNAGQQ